MLTLMLVLALVLSCFLCWGLSRRAIVCGLEELEGGCMTG